MQSFQIILPQPGAFDNSQLTNSTDPGGYNSPMKLLYLEDYLLLNALTDYLLCLSTGRLCALRLRRGRYLLAALLGTAYAAAALLPGAAALSSPWGKAGAGIAMGLAAFGGEARPGRCILALLAVAATFGGALYALSLLPGGPPVFSLRSLAAAFFLCYGALKLLARFRSRWNGGQKAAVRLRFTGREADFLALVDSGNGLRDPGTGESVLIASPAALRPVFAEYTVLLEELQPVELLETAADIPAIAGRLRLIPFRSLGGAGLLPVFRPDGLWIDGRETDDVLVAISRQAGGNGYEAIL